MLAESLSAFDPKRTSAGLACNYD